MIAKLKWLSMAVVGCSMDGKRAMLAKEGPVILPC